MTMTIHFMNARLHYGDVVMGTVASQVTSLTIVNQPFIRVQIKENIKDRGPVNSPHKWPGTRKIFPFDEVIMRHVIPIICKYVRKIKTTVPFQIIPFLSAKCSPKKNFIICDLYLNLLEE